MQWTILTGKKALIDKQFRKRKPFEGYKHCFVNPKMNTERPANRLAFRILKLSSSVLYISILSERVYKIMVGHSWCSAEVSQEAMLLKCTCEWWYIPSYQKSLIKYNFQVKRENVWEQRENPDLISLYFHEVSFNPKSFWQLWGRRWASHSRDVQTSLLPHAS